MKRFLLFAMAVLIAAVGVADGGVIKPSPADSQHPRWLADGTGIAFLSNLETHSFTLELLVASDKGEGLRVASPTDRSGVRTDESPDGQQIAYIKDQNLYISAIDGTNEHALTDDGQAYATNSNSVAWSPGGRQIAFVCCLNGNANNEVVQVIDVDGTRRHTIHRGTSVLWIGDAELAVGLEGYSTEIYRVRSDGRYPRTMVTGYYSPGGFDISPDLTQIAFTSETGFAYDTGRTIYAADTRAQDLNLRRISPDVCAVEAKPTSNLGGDCYDGTNGRDEIVGTVKGDLIVSGAGDDAIRAGDGENIIQTQWGNDEIRSGAGPDFINAGSGADDIRSGAGNDRIQLGQGKDTVDAGGGTDYIYANDGQRDQIRCGSGDDRVRVDRIDIVRGCEHVVFARPTLDQP